MEQINRIKFLLAWIAILCMIPLFAYPGAEQRLLPILYKSCDSRDNKDYPVRNLWDNNTDQMHKWCCFHAGYTTPQVHWIIMDLGAIYPVTKIVIEHEGNEKEQLHLLTEDFTLFGSIDSMSGPWTVLKDIKDNKEKINTLAFPGIKIRYLGLEVTDSQVGSGPNQKQDDWAVRISEFSIYTQGSQIDPFPPVPDSPPSPFDLSPTPPAPVPTATGTGVQFPENVKALVQQKTTEKPERRLYYFYHPNVEKCQSLERFFMTPRVIELLKRYSFEPVNTLSNESLIRQYAVFMVPTFILTDRNGKVLKKSSVLGTEEELIKFLE